jgi:hypothetical protein
LRIIYRLTIDYSRRGQDSSPTRRYQNEQIRLQPTAVNIDRLETKKSPAAIGHRANAKSGKVRDARTFI